MMECVRRSRYLPNYQISRAGYFAFRSLLSARKTKRRNEGSDTLYIWDVVYIGESRARASFVLSARVQSLGVPV